MHFCCTGTADPSRRSISAVSVVVSVGQTHFILPTRQRALATPGGLLLALSFSVNASRWLSSRDGRTKGGHDGSKWCLMAGERLRARLQSSFPSLRLRSSARPVALQWAAKLAASRLTKQENKGNLTSVCTMRRFIWAKKQSQKKNNRPSCKKDARFCFCQDSLASHTDQASGRLILFRCLWLFAGLPAALNE